MIIYKAFADAMVDKYRNKTINYDQHLHFLTKIYKLQVKGSVNKTHALLQ